MIKTRPVPFEIVIIITQEREREREERAYIANNYTLQDLACSG